MRADDLAVWHAEQKLTWQQAHASLDRWVARISTVFNLAQTAGLTLDPVDPKPLTSIPTVERAERLLASMRRDGVQFETDNRSAYYVPPRDTVYLPERNRFDSAEGYYGTALHEIGHATGAAKRLGRTASPEITATAPSPMRARNCGRSSSASSWRPRLESLTTRASTGPTSSPGPRS